MVSAMMNINMIYFAEGRIPQRIGNRYESTYPYDSFKTKDGDVIIGAGNDKLYRLLCQEMGREDLLEDPRFRTVSDRVANHEAMKEYVEAWTLEQTVDEVADRLNKIGVPSSPINTIDRVARDPQIAGARKMFVDVEHPVAGKVTVTNNQASAPLLGQHNEDVYCGLLKLDKAELDRLKAEGTI